MARARSRLLTLSDLLEDLLVGRKAERLVLGIDWLPVEGYVEHTPVTALEISGHPESLLDGGLQTGGLGVVVSFHAVRDPDVHELTPFRALMIPDGAGGQMVAESSAEEPAWARSA